MLIAGSVVLLLGLFNVKNSLNLMGINTNQFLGTSTEQTAGVANTVARGEQIVNMAVQGINYIPSVITIQKDVPVKWVIDGSGASGCTSVLVVSSLGINKSLSRSGDTIIEFTPTKLGRIPFTCGMGMSYGEFLVVDALPEAVEPECDSDVQTCS